MSKRRTMLMPFTLAGAGMTGVIQVGGDSMGPAIGDCSTICIVALCNLWSSCSSSVVVGRGAAIVVDARKTGAVPIATRPLLALLLGHKFL